jgi:hypothetical protein
MITKAEAEQFVRGVFTEVWIDRNQAAVAKYYHPDFVGLLHGTEEFHYGDVLKRVDYNRQRYADPGCEFHDIYPIEENKIVARVSMSLFDRQEQQNQTLHFMALIEMKEGKMYRQWTLSSQAYRYKEWD